MKSFTSTKVLLSISISLNLFYGVFSKTLLIRTNDNDFYVVENGEDGWSKYELLSTDLQVSADDKRHAKPVSTVILQGDGVSTTLKGGMKSSAANIFLKLSKVIVIEELIVAENVPREYLRPLATEATMELRKTIKYVSLYACESGFFKQALCRMFPQLEELTIELVDMQDFVLSSCRNLKKLRIQGTAVFADATGNDVNGDRIIQIMTSLNHVLHATTTKSLKLGPWAWSLYDEEQKLFRNRVPLVDVNELELGAVINPELEHIEIAPCDAITLIPLLSIWKQMNQQATTFRLHLGTYEILGKFAAFNIFIYDMAVGPNELAAFFGGLKSVDGNAYLGIRFDEADRLSLEWLEFVCKFPSLNHLNIHGRTSILGSLISMKRFFRNVLGKLSVLSLTINEKNLEKLNSNTLSNSIGNFLSTFRSVSLDLELFGQNVQLPKSCTQKARRGNDDTKSVKYQCKWKGKKTP